jgi:uncharacterized membrane protein
MIVSVYEWIKNIPPDLQVMVLGAVPIAELRGAIPLGFFHGLPVARVFFLAVLGNIIPIIPVLFLLEPVSNALMRVKPCKKFFDWFFERTRARADSIQKYEALGLAIFVAIPLPMTGAWSGAVAASLFKIKFRYAFPAIVAGVFVAGIIVTALCMVGAMSWKALAR